MNIEKQNKVAVIAITPNGVELAKVISGKVKCDCFTKNPVHIPHFYGFQKSMRETVADLFMNYDVLIFICATGIVVRMIADLVKDKLYDPAVLVMDEQANFVISLLSGHIGGANAWAEKIAKIVKATPVITTATDVNHKASLDLLIKRVHADPLLHREAIKVVNQKLVIGEKVGLYIDPLLRFSTPLYQEGFTRIENLMLIPEDLTYLVVISMKDKLSMIDAIDYSHIIPCCVVLGVGCRKDTSFEVIKEQLQKHLEFNNVTEQALCEIGSVSLKKNEKGLIELGTYLNIPFHTFSVETLAPYAELFPKSEFVQKIINIGSVSEPTAWYLSGGHLLTTVTKESGVTLTLGIKEL